MLLKAISIASMLTNATRSGGREVVIDRTAEGLYRNALTYLELWKTRALKSEGALMVAQQSCDNLQSEVQELRRSVAILLKENRQRA